MKINERVRIAAYYRKLRTTVRALSLRKDGSPLAGQGGPLPDHVSRVQVCPQPAFCLNTPQTALAGRAVSRLCLELPPKGVL